MENIKVSIICNAFNHALYIEDCLRGFVMQKTDFPFEVLVHDDASSDNTAEIIRRYERMYPEIIKPIYQTENQFSKGMLASFQYPRVKGEYVAVCEGDDFWTDEYKLQKQYNAMQAHPEADICAHAASRYDCLKNEVTGEIAPKAEDCVIDISDVILGRGAYVATASLFYRASLLKNEPDFRKSWRIDYSLQILGSLRGGMVYLKDNMATYRYMTPGSWSMAQKNDIERKIKVYTKTEAMLRLLDKDTNGAHKKVIERRLLENEWEYMSLLDRYDVMMEKRFLELRKELPAKKRVSVMLKAYFPWSYRLLRRIKGGIGKK